MHNILRGGNMYSNLLKDNPKNQTVDDIKDVFDLNLIIREDFGNTLFLIGTFLSFFSSKQAETDIIQRKSESQMTQDTQSPLNSPAKTVAAASWVFLIASIVFATISYLRLNEQKATTSSSPSPTSARNLAGREISTLGSFVKVVGFALAAIGNQIIASSYGDNTESIM
jgi:hypothetical protein